MRLNITESGSDSSLHADVSLRALPENDKAADKSKNHKVVILSAAKYLYKMAAWILRFTQNDKFARNKILLLVRE